MGVHEGRGQLAKAMKELRFRWTEVNSCWNDAMSRDFEQRHLAPLEQDLRNALGAMDRMAALLQQIRQDCE